MNDPRLDLIIRTPRAIIFEGRVDSLRVASETGQVGIRPRMEPLVLAVEPGLVLVKSSGQTTYAGTAGGLLRCDGKQAHFLTPLAVYGSELETVASQLEAALDSPSVELEARETLGRLERSILRELQDSDEKRGQPNGKGV
ncbi:hypothetical protein C5Y96_22655 [Blastopirellula marina]|uniref:ATP synthase epsilon chain n=1 Tax=Blastopirellula marina TaxID=124 RepID=A0A2S8F0E4_9BACT|nr:MULTISPECIES: hypothetical protein [Pirellulaceae]PQO25626.1 hypothetical protein C5Y96_22655 [Blastopirellula marina]RCS43309.1 hypothetical protein DTL36_22705 [Bremerella cremea]